MKIFHEGQIRHWSAISLVAAAIVFASRVAGGADSTTTNNSPDSSPFPLQVKFTGDGDHQNMMDQLGIKALRPGADPNNQSTFDEATANKYPLPDLMTMKDGTKVTTPEQWKARRAEIQEDFEREVYGRIPTNVPKVTVGSHKNNNGHSGKLQRSPRRWLDTSIIPPIH